ncbi:predicted protein [Naegleria gruberi]|uniref:Predicted protein n=1 Tax=Naegleria gruberi TaxID=5762 RepID=D2V345_NAEGR|nr:uncharacterized protein NAEGRDRAFT_46318 [Naegleria gruberi]EFC48569.1 predicted protein [Naegleria gruberi]|eukprot:XP_002681313.1 predicted protein [Naegleria gruberi strain NEG-M]
MSNVSIEFYEVPDGTFGSPSTTSGNWTGTIGELMTGRADVMVGPLTITQLRHQVIDFTTSFFDVGLSILTTKQGEESNLFSFLLPFSWEVWILIFASALIVALLTWFFDHVSPYGHSKQDDDSKNELDFSGSLINACMTISGQDGNPGKSWSTRVMLLGYFLFVMIILSTYTANLAAVLTTKVQSTRVTGLSDIRTYGFKFAVAKNSAPASFISSSEEMADIKKNMVLYDSLDDCIKALREGQVDALIWVSSILEYMANQPPCDTLIVGDLFNPGNYGLPFAKGNWMIGHFSSILLSMRESGLVEKLKKKWWIEKGSCSLVASSQEASGVKIQDLGGIFLILAGFIFVGGLILIFELVYRAIYDKTKNRTKHLKYLNRFLGGEKHQESDKEEQELKTTNIAASTQSLQTDENKIINQ